MTLHLKGYDHFGSIQMYINRHNLTYLQSLLNRDCVFFLPFSINSTSINLKRKKKRFRKIEKKIYTDDDDKL